MKKGGEKIEHRTSRKQLFGEIKSNPTPEALLVFTHLHY